MQCIKLLPTGRKGLSNRPRRSAFAHANFTVMDSLMRYARLLGYGDVHLKVDPETGLRAIIAVHSVKRGPAIGGCRMVPYASMESAMEDALRLGYMMSYKAAINNLPHGGGKAVILKPKIIKDREAFFQKFGEFVQEVGGRYITAVDSGTSPKEMDIIERSTSFVTCTSKGGAADNPSPLTALGVLRGIEAAVKYKLHRNSLEGVHVAIQGVGHVGYSLAEQLLALGAKITITDINSVLLKQCQEKLNVNVCEPDEILRLNADVFAPCALGSILNLHTIDDLQFKIVAGAANNQLSHYTIGTLLHEKNILYVPDFVINAGGLIHVAVVYDQGDIERSKKIINEIYDTCNDIFAQSKFENKATNIIAEKIAREKLKA